MARDNLLFLDVHGQFYDLLRYVFGPLSENDLFRLACSNTVASRPKPITCSLEIMWIVENRVWRFVSGAFDGDSCLFQTICLLLAYKVKYPENFFLLRGNHECASINRIYGFYDECKR
jgi:hypothetical protein